MHVILPTTPSVCCRTTLQQLEVCEIVVNSLKKSKNRITFDKNRKITCHTADYCYDSC